MNLSLVTLAASTAPAFNPSLFASIMLARRTAPMIEVPCADCDGNGYHTVARTLANEAGEVRCNGCKGQASVMRPACIVCHVSEGTDHQLCEGCMSGDAAMARYYIGDDEGELLSRGVRC